MRVEELHLAAVADPERRILLMTGAIDSTDFTIMVRLKLPVGGLWTVIKAKTNLTNVSWNHWVIFLGEQISMPAKAENRLLFSRQFADAAYFPDENAIVYGGGEVRPGESLLTMYTAELTAGNVYGAIYGSPAIGGEPLLTTLEDVLSYTIQQDAPQEDMTVPVRIQKGPEQMVRRLGFD